MKDLEMVDGKYVREEGGEVLEVYKEGVEEDGLLRDRAGEGGGD